MPRRTTLSTVAAATSLALVTACGATSSGASNDSSAAPKTEFNEALKALSAGSALTTTISLGTTGADIIRIGGIGGDGSPSDAPTPAEANAIAAGYVTIESVAPKGKTLSQAAAAGGGGAAAAVTFGSGSTTYFTLRSVNKNLYFNLDLKDLLAVSGSEAEYASLQAQVASLPPFVQALIAGKWVSLSTDTVQEIEGLAQGAAGAGQVPSTSEITKLQHALTTALLGDVTATRTSSGDTDKLALSANIRTIVTDVLAAVTHAIPAAASSLGSVPLSQVPDQSIKVDASVTGGALSKLTLDVGQFSTTTPFSLPVNVTFRKIGAPITVPPGATAIDFTQLGALIGAAGAVSSGSTSVGSGSAPAPTVKKHKAHKK